MNEVSGVAEQSAQLAGNSQAGLSRMEETMRHVMEAAGAINAKLTDVTCGLNFDPGDRVGIFHPVKP